MSKYDVKISGIGEDCPNDSDRITVVVDVYDVLKAFNVTNPAIAHAVKKLLKAGDRGYKDIQQDYNEAIASIQRGVELEARD